MLYYFNSQQISNIAENSYRTEGTGANAPETKESQFSYDANGNLLGIYTGTKQGDKLKVTNTRKMLWDEENHLLASCDNGYLTAYYYDAAGERTVKMSGDAEGVYVNGALSGARTGTANFTAYINPYMAVNNGGIYTKHIYMGSQRITSKVGNFFTVSNSPVENTALQAKYVAQTAKIKERFDSLGVKYSGIQHSGTIISGTTGTAGTYFYHPDHLGSSSLITDPTGAIAQHVEYVPFGETFIDERNSTWQTPYLFNAKERDAETGLHYYGARYYDSEGVHWLSTDPLKEDYPGFSSYVYCYNNPIVYYDPDGRQGMAGPRMSQIMEHATPQQMQSVGKWMLRLGSPIEDIYGVYSGKDFDGNAYNRASAAGFTLFAIAPELKMFKYLDKALDGLKAARTVNAGSVNRLFLKMGMKAPYDNAYKIIEGTTKVDTKFVRVHGKDNKVGRWLMDANEIKGLSPEQIRDKFALPDIPTQISEVTVPAGTNIRVGTAAEIKEFGKGGGLQVEVLQKVQESWISNTKSLNQ